MVITNKFTVDLASRSVPQVIDAVQCDANTRAVEVTLLAGSVAWDPPAGVSVSVAYQKADGTKGWYDKLPDGTVACSAAGNVVTAILAPQALTAAGKSVAAIIFQDADSLDQLATFPFEINVERNPAAGQVVSNDYYNYSTMADVNEAVDSYIAKIQQTMESYLEKAENALEVIQEVVTGDSADAPAIVCSAEGKVICVSDSSDRLLQNLRIFGKTTQDGTPSLDAPVAMVGTGGSGRLTVNVAGNNLLQYPYVETTKTVNGVTFTDNGDGSITVAGTATSQANFWLCYASNKGLSGLGKCTISSGTENMYGVLMWTVSDGAGNPRANLNTQIDMTGRKAGFALSVMSGATVNTTVWPMLNGGETALPWEPYMGQSAQLSTPGGLPGIPVPSGGNCIDTDAGQRYMSDYRDYASGVDVSNVIRLVFDGTEAWALYSGAFRLKTADVEKMKSKYEGGRHICNYFAFGSGSLTDGQFGKSDFLYFNTGEFTTVDQWKAWLAEIYAAGTPLTVLGVRNEAVETPISAADLAAYAALHSNKPNTTAYNDAGAHMEFSYVADTKTYIDQKLAAISAAMLNT